MSKITAKELSYELEEFAQALQERASKLRSEISKMEKDRKDIEEEMEASATGFVHKTLDDLESDDMISYYCKIAIDENITIFSSDKDLTQLIKNNVRIYSPIEKIFVTNNDKVKIDKLQIPFYNIVTYKIIRGDRSDNVFGIYNLGEKKIIKYFPEIENEKVSIQDIYDKTKKLFEKNPKNKTLENILLGKTKEGIYGDEFFVRNKKLVDLETDYLTNEEKDIINQIYSDVIDPEDRGYQNLIRMMKEDGIFKYLPKNDDWTSFITPFLKLTRKEKKKFKESKK